MTPEEIKSRIQTEIGDGWELEYPHGIELRRCLVEPELREYMDAEENIMPGKIWLVLEEDPSEHKGYSIVYNESEDAFGLAIATLQGKNMCIGLYGTFLETLNNM